MSWGSNRRRLHRKSVPMRKKNQMAAAACSPTPPSPPPSPTTPSLSAPTAPPPVPPTHIFPSRPPSCLTARSSPLSTPPSTDSTPAALLLFLPLFRLRLLLPLHLLVCSAGFLPGQHTGAWPKTGWQRRRCRLLRVLANTLLQKYVPKPVFFFQSWA